MTLILPPPLEMATELPWLDSTTQLATKACSKKLEEIFNIHKTLAVRALYFLRS
jgi:hypothetical protein